MSENIDIALDLETPARRGHNFFPTEAIESGEAVRARMIAQDLAFQEAMRREHPERCPS